MLALSDLRKRFGPVQALDGCSFAVERGRMLGFLGPNGAGKTTTMRAIFGLVALDAGEVMWDGRPVGLEDRLRFGYVPEERGLYPRMPVGDQVAYFGRLHGMGVEEARAAASHGWSGSAWMTCDGQAGGAFARQPAAGAACGGADSRAAAACA
jgi:ABC-2 type transport system ATP-binding protein